MKKLFRGYYKLNEEDLTTLWQNSIFIFDTNVLLNLYRYQSTTRDALLKVIEQLSQRVWIPYHVGLEFQRNRLNVIAAQHKRFSDVKKTVENSLDTIKNTFDSYQLKTKHSHINPDKLIEDLNVVKNNFFEELAKLEEKSLDVTSEDKILDRIDSLFQNKIGSPPESQKEIDDLVIEGHNRYKNSIPPGFKDSSKDKSDQNNFTYGGIVYNPSFGDLVIWKQIIKFAKKTKAKDIIYITDDTKSDWWRHIDSNGSKTIGARPELIDELHRESSVERFHIYTSDNFLNFANKYLDTKVAQDAINEVREVSSTSETTSDFYVSPLEQIELVETALHSWLREKVENVTFTNGYPDAIAFQGFNKIGFDLYFFKRYVNSSHRIPEHIQRVQRAITEDNFHEITIVYALPNLRNIDAFVYQINNNLLNIKENIKIIVGFVNFECDSTESVYFLPFFETSTQVL